MADHFGDAEVFSMDDAMLVREPLLRLFSAPAGFATSDMQDGMLQDWEVWEGQEPSRAEDLARTVGALKLYQSGDGGIGLLAPDVRSPASCPKRLSLQEKYHVILVVDTSESMRENDAVPTCPTMAARHPNRLGCALEAAADLLATLRAQDEGHLWSCVAFNHKASVVVSSEEVPEPQAIPEELLKTPGPMGGTIMCHALDAAAELLMPREHGRTLVVLLSDGEDDPRQERTASRELAVRSMQEWAHISGAGPVRLDTVLFSGTGEGETTLKNMATAFAEQNGGDLFSEQSAYHRSGLSASELCDCYRQILRSLVN